MPMKLLTIVFLCATLMLTASISWAQPNTAGSAAVPIRRTLEQSQKPEQPAATDQKKEGKDFLWKVASDKGQAYILGTLHMVPKNFPPIPAEIEQAFQSSNYLVVELDDSKADPYQMQQVTKQKGMYPPEDGLSKHISSLTKEVLDSYLSKAGITTSVFDVFKPWLAGLTISVAELQRQGFDTQAGLDKHFIREAKASNKEVLELESIDFQINLLSGFSDDLQDKLLLQSLLEIKDAKTEAQKMIDAWCNGNSEKMLEVVTKDLAEHPELKPVLEKLVDERNISMEKKIEEYLARGGTYFVAVGAGHLVGEKGIIHLLQDKGYKVEQVTKSSIPASVSGIQPVFVGNSI